MRSFTSPQDPKAQRYFKYLTQSKRLFGSILWQDNSVTVYDMQSKEQFERDHDTVFVAQARAY